MRISTERTHVCHVFSENYEGIDEMTVNKAACLAFAQWNPHPLVTHSRVSREQLWEARKIFCPNLSEKRLCYKLSLYKFSQALKLFVHIIFLYHVAIHISLLRWQ